MSTEPLVSVDEMRSLLNEHGWTVATLGVIAALVAERLAELELVRVAGA